MDDGHHLAEIARWRLEAKEEDSTRYFYQLPDFSTIEDGSSCYVIGRKGAGKTAIAEHFKSLVSYDFFVRTLSFKNFPFNELYKLEDRKFTTPSQYTTIWKYIIYSALCNMMAMNERLDPKVTALLRDFFDFDLEKALAPSVARIIDGSFDLNIFGLGGKVGLKKGIEPNPHSWADRVDILERLIDSHIDNSKYYVIFDELDEDYEDILNVDRKSKYFELLIGLFKAVHDIRGKFRNPNHVRPIVFLRDDIYELIQNNDKNKWDDLSVNLRWSPDTLSNLLAFRISRAIKSNGHLLSFQDAYQTTFREETVRYGYRTRHRRPILTHILNRTLMRPRDLVSYMRECAKIARHRGVDKISGEIVKKADEEYSQRFRKEMIDEIQSILPYIPEVLDIFSKMRKQTFSFSQFQQEYKAASQTITNALDFHTVCKLLFHFSVIGNQPAQQNTRIFRYLSPNAKINFTEIGIIHPGLLKALQIN
ncbi:P-loop ATPase, Sll1717 family [Bradyrhizobium oligotrophicum]|uniref:P-loop ATPase, Sll1717 family n=1 Tax=Bradyrhizobium oligotrophicum TaxID=44255 RepID=UPI003EC0544E